MGSFNVSCSVSRLPITTGTPMRAFILAGIKTPQDKMIFNPEALFVPLTAGLSGTYNDYGGIEDCKKPSPLFSATQAHYFPHYSGTAENLIDSLREEPQALSLHRHGKAHACETSIAYIREDVYRQIMRYNPNEGKFTEDYCIDRKKLSAELKNIKKAFEKSAQLHQQSLLYVSVKSPEQLALIKNVYFEVNHDWRLAPLFHNYPENSLLHAAMEPCRTRLERLLLQEKGAPKKETLDLAAEILEHLHFNRVLAELNVLWQPTVLMAGQEPSFTLHHAFNKAVGKICEREVKARTLKPVKNKKSLHRRQKKRRP